MKTVHLVVVGKNKDDSLSTLENSFSKRLKTISLKIHELKHFASKSKNDEQVIQKAKNIAGKTAPKIILLDERGKTFNSVEFSTWIFNLFETTDALIFVIGGAEGHGMQIKKQAQSSFRLSDFTLPHRMARILLIEQIYRAETLHVGHPYHK